MVYRHDDIQGIYMYIHGIYVCGYTMKIHVYTWYIGTTGYTMYIHGIYMNIQPISVRSRYHTSGFLPPTMSYVTYDVVRHARTISYV